MHRSLRHMPGVGDPAADRAIVGPLIAQGACPLNEFHWHQSIQTVELERACEIRSRTKKPVRVHHLLTCTNVLRLKLSALLRRQ